jgi:hypothetical protein
VGHQSFAKKRRTGACALPAVFVVLRVLAVLRCGLIAFYMYVCVCVRVCVRVCARRHHPRTSCLASAEQFWRVARARGLRVFCGSALHLCASVAAFVLCGGGGVASRAAAAALLVHALFSIRSRNPPARLFACAVKMQIFVKTLTGAAARVRAWAAAVLRARVAVLRAC